MASKNIARVGKNCVACGCCVKVCPMDAISVWKGITAVTDISKCVGCGKCAGECPAGVIDITPREGMK